ncbi:hypothetical protein [Aquihabitans sp. McL0605]|uniref:hypothetical protein n=1 Tax=Aquihabitans sp. McL0605 TaxID=3415671 RepID=UPI003CF7E68C
MQQVRGGVGGSGAAEPVIPPYVKHSLTPLGDELVEHLLPLFRWILDHAADIVG